MHILLWLHPLAKFSNIGDIDRIIYAEIRNKDSDSIGYDVVTNFMMHGLCGFANKKSPCMVKGKCAKFFPKQFQNKTEIREDGFPVYRIRDKGYTTVKNGIQLGNRFFVPYNVDIIVKFQSHQCRGLLSNKS